MLEDYDEEWGGFGRQPKFPRTSSLEFLLRHHRRTGDPSALAAATGTLDAMAAAPPYVGTVWRGVAGNVAEEFAFGSKMTCPSFVTAVT